MSLPPQSAYPCLAKEKKRPPVPGSDLSPWRHGVSIAFAHTNAVRKNFDCFLTSAGIDVCQTGSAVVGGFMSLANL